MTDRIVQKAFEYFFRKFYCQDKYQFHYTPNTLKMYENLVKEINKKYNVLSLGDNFIWRYCIFQFAYWQDLTISTPSNKLTFAHIFGKKAVDRYFMRDRDYDWQLESNNILARYKMNQSEFNIHIGQKEDEIEFSNSPIRLKFLNTDKGFATCLAQTTLIDRRDTSCLSCNFQDQCIEALKNTYPKIYKDRYGR